MTVEGPVTGGERGLPYNAMPDGMAEEFGYREDEYLVSGTATSYTGDALLTEDGQWSASPAAEADYTTRILVRQPEDPADFNGVVVVEWHNVTVARDSDPDWGFLHPELMRGATASSGCRRNRSRSRAAAGSSPSPASPRATWCR